MKTEIIAILDRSGSMQPIKAESIGGFNHFLAEQKLVPGEAKMTVVLFDNVVSTLYAGVPLDRAEALTGATYVPRGYTALNDAIGRTLNVEGERIKREAWADKVIVVILTDGGENASHEYSIGRVKRMVEHAEACGWSFVYLAANVNAFATGSAFGISAAHTQSFASNSVGTQQAYASASVATRSLRSDPVDPALLSAWLAGPPAAP